jgi:predicted  nucleic acid-binding Zn-ribbon protein
MKLSRALTEKNRLAGDIKKLSVIICRENSRMANNPTKVDVAAFHRDLVAKTQELSILKSRIAKTNYPIYDKIFLMGELKGEISFLDTIPTKDGIYSETQGYATQSKDIEYKAIITQSDIDMMKDELQKRINSLQDELNEFNSSTDLVD